MNDDVTRSRPSSVRRLVARQLALWLLVVPAVAAEEPRGALVELFGGPPPNRGNHVFRLEELCRFALELSPRIHEDEYRVDARRADVVLRRNDLLPVLNLNANYTSSQSTDLLRTGARINWYNDWSELNLRDLRLARLGMLSAEEYARRERVWVLNEVANKFRNLAVMEMHVATYERVIAVTSDLDTAERGFDVERDLKIDEYQTDLTRIQNQIVDVTSQLSALAFADPYGRDLRIDASSVRYSPVPIDTRAILRRTIKERMRPDVLDFYKSEILIKTATRRYQPSLNVGLERWRVDGVAGQGYTADDTTISAGINLVVNPFASKATHRRAIAELNVAKAVALVELNDLVNSAKRALDRFFQARNNLLDHYHKYGEEPVDFSEGLQEVFGPDLESLDRQVFTTLDLLLRNDQKRIEYLSDYVSALITLNNHVMVTPLNQQEYQDLDPDNSMPEIFEYLLIPESTYEQHRRELISP